MSLNEIYCWFPKCPWTLRMAIVTERHPRQFINMVCLPVLRIRQWGLSKIGDPPLRVCIDQIADVAQQCRAAHPRAMLVIFRRNDCRRHTSNLMRLPIENLPNSSRSARRILRMPLGTSGASVIVLSTTALESSQCALTGPRAIFRLNPTRLTSNAGSSTWALLTLPVASSL